MDGASSLELLEGVSRCVSFTLVLSEDKDKALRGQRSQCLHLTFCPNIDLPFHLFLIRNRTSVVQNLFGGMGHEK